MDPNPQYNPQPPSNPYDFIVNSGKTPKRPVLGGGGSQKQRIIVAAVGALILLIAAMIFFSILGNAGKQSFDDSLRIVKLQREMLQASEVAMNTSPNADTRTYAATISTTITSDNIQLEAFLNKNNQKKQLAAVAKKNTTIEETLAKAVSNNDFDTAYNKLMGELLQKYINELKTSNAESKSKSEKEFLEASFQHVRTLTQVPEPTQ